MEKSVLCCEKFSGKMLTHELGKIIPESEKTIADKSGAIAGSDMSIGFFGIQDAPLRPIIFLLSSPVVARAFPQDDELCVHNLTVAIDFEPFTKQVLEFRRGWQ